MPAQNSATPSRVLMTADAVGGVWTYSLDLSRLLAARGVGVVLAVMGPAPDDSQRDEAHSIPNLELRHKSFDLEWFQNVSGLDLARSCDWLRQIAREHAVDLVHLNGYAHAAANWEVPVLVAAHSCVYSWWMSVHGTFPPNEYRVYRGRIIAGLRAASAVIAPSRWMLDTLQSTYNVPLPFSEVIPNFTDARANEARKEAFILACGRFWDTAKNLMLLDRIASELSWPVSVAGRLEGPEAGSGVSRHLNTMGQLSRPKMVEQFSKAAIFAHPARYEPFGLAVLEAAAAGCALVLSDIPSLRELWDECAIFVSPDDSGQWIQRLNRLAENGSERMSLAIRARRRAAEFIPEIAVCRYLNLYDKLTAAGQSSANKTSELHEHPHQTVLPLHRF